MAALVLHRDPAAGWSAPQHPPPLHSTPFGWPVPSATAPATVPFAPSTTSAFSIPVKPVASAPLPNAVYAQLGQPNANAGIRHSSGSAFTPAAAGAMLGSRVMAAGPALQMAVLPVLHSAGGGVAAVPALHSAGGGVVVSPWPLSHPLPIRPAACTAEQLQALMQGAAMASGGFPDMASSGFSPDRAVASALPGPVYMPHTAAVEGQGIPMQLALGLS